MWKLRIKQGYNEMVLQFEKLVDAINIIDEVMAHNAGQEELVFNLVKEGAKHESL